MNPAINQRGFASDQRVATLGIGIGIGIAIEIEIAIEILARGEGLDPDPDPDFDYWEASSVRCRCRRPLLHVEPRIGEQRAFVYADTTLMRIFTTKKKH